MTETGQEAASSVGVEPSSALVGYWNGEKRQRARNVKEYVLQAYEFGRANKLHELLNVNRFTVDDLDYVIHLHGLEFDRDYIPMYLRFRSGLQFLIESPNTLDNAEEHEYDMEAVQFDDEYFKESVEQLDERFRTWKTDDSDYPFCGGHALHTKDEIERPDNIPESHWWWWTENEG